MRAQHWLFVLAVLPSACFAQDWNAYYQRELEVTGCTAEEVEGERLHCPMIRERRDRMKERQERQEADHRKLVESIEKADRAREAESLTDAEQQGLDAAWQVRCSKKGQPKLGMTRAQLVRIIEKCWDVYSDPISLETSTAFHETIPLISRAGIATVHLRNGIVIGIRREAR